MIPDEKLISYVFVTRGAISEIGKGNWIYIVLPHAVNFACTPKAHESYLKSKYLCFELGHYKSNVYI